MLTQNFEHSPKDWDSAMKVLHSMFSLENIVISKKAFEFLNSLNFLPISFNHGVIFEHLGFDSKANLFFVLSFVIVLFLNNSNYMANNFKANRRNLFFTILMLIYAIPMITNISEFLYFNF